MSSEVEDEMNSDQETRDDEFMKEPAQFVGEIDPDQENIHKQDVLCNGKTRKDAEELAIKLLAKRLVHIYHCAAFCRFTLFVVQVIVCY